MKYDEELQIHYLKNMLGDYINRYGGDLDLASNSEQKTKCIFSIHKGVTSSLVYCPDGANTHCYCTVKGCWGDSDIFKLVGLFEGIEKYEDRVKRATEIYGCYLDSPTCGDAEEREDKDISENRGPGSYQNKNHSSTEEAIPNESLHLPKGQDDVLVEGRIRSRYKSLRNCHLHTITSKHYEGIFHPAKDINSIGLLRARNRDDFKVINSEYRYKERFDTPIAVKDLETDCSLDGITPEQLLLIRYLYSIARETRLYNRRNRGSLSVNGRELEIFTGISMRGSYHGRFWEDRFSELKNIVVIFEDGKVYSVADYSEHKELCDEYIFDVTFFDVLQDVLSKKHSYKGRIKPHHSHLIHSDARVIRDNPLALFFVEALLSGLHRRGEYLPPLDDKERAHVTKDRRMIPYRTTYDYCVRKVPHLDYKLSDLQTANSRNKLLKRLREAVEEIISDASDISEYFSDFEMDLPDVTSQKMDAQIVIRHRGMNRVLDYLED